MRSSPEEKHTGEEGRGQDYCSNLLYPMQEENNTSSGSGASTHKSHPYRQVQCSLVRS